MTLTDPSVIQMSALVGLIIAIGIGLWNAVKIREVHLSMNSRLDQLLMSSIGEAHAAGVEAERNREIARLSADAREVERRGETSDKTWLQDEDKGRK